MPTDTATRSPAPPPPAPIPAAPIPAAPVPAGTPPVIGWREWVGLPDLGVPRIKVKVDTGARSSAVHAFGVEYFERDGSDWVRFELHPRQRSDRTTVTAEAELLDRRPVRSSNGKQELRPVIVTHAVLLGRRFPIELTLTNRDAMGFRMLLGREAVRRRFLIDPGLSYAGGRPRKADAAASEAVNLK